MMDVSSVRQRAGNPAASTMDAALLRAGYSTMAAMTVLALARGALGTIWFVETLWKLPWKNYGCPADFALKSSGLCDWIGRLQCPERDVAEGRVENVLSGYAPSGSRTRRNTRRPPRTR